MRQTVLASWHPPPPVPATDGATIFIPSSTTIWLFSGSNGATGDSVKLESDPLQVQFS